MDFTVPARGCRVLQDRRDSCYGIGENRAYTENFLLNILPVVNRHGRPPEKEYMDGFLKASIALSRMLGDATQK